MDVDAAGMLEAEANNDWDLDPTEQKPVVDEATGATLSPQHIVDARSVELDRFKKMGV